MPNERIVSGFVDQIVTEMQRAQSWYELELIYNAATHSPHARATNEEDKKLIESVYQKRKAWLCQTGSR